MPEDHVFDSDFTRADDGILPLRVPHLFARAHGDPPFPCPLGRSRGTLSAQCSRFRAQFNFDFDDFEISMIFLMILSMIQIILIRK